LLARYAAKAAIEQCLATHNRGIDRADYALMTSAYHDGATIDFGFFAGSAHEFARIIVDSQTLNRVSQHRTCQSWIVVEGDEARAESYVVAVIDVPDAPGAGCFQRFIGGRYLDRLAARAGEWRLVDRSYVMDWNCNHPSPVAFEEFGLNQFTPRGGLQGADIGRALLTQWTLAIKARGNGATKSMDSQKTDVDALLSKQSIKELTFKVARAIDRQDFPLLASAFHDGATFNAGVVSGSMPDAGKALIAQLHSGVKRSQHAVSNQWFEVFGDEAIGESYVLGTAFFDQDGVEQELRFGGRYLDRFERRDGIWKISERVIVADFTGVQPSTHTEDGMYAAMSAHGGRMEADPISTFWIS
jgi:hypothetical protein